MSRLNPTQTVNPKTLFPRGSGAFLAPGSESRWQYRQRYVWPADVRVFNIGALTSGIELGAWGGMLL